MNEITCPECGSYDVIIDISDYSVKCKKCKFDFKIDNKKDKNYLED